MSRTRPCVDSLLLQDDGRPVSTGRWILLRNRFFLLRAAHTIQWIENPSLKAGYPDTEAVLPSIVWDWKSSAERWRWTLYEIAEAKSAMTVEIEAKESDGDAASDLP